MVYWHGTSGHLENEALGHGPVQRAVGSVTRHIGVPFRGHLKLRGWRSGQCELDMEGRLLRRSRAWVGVHGLSSRRAGVLAESSGQ